MSLTELLGIGGFILAVWKIITDYFERISAQRQHLYVLQTALASEFLSMDTSLHVLQLRYRSTFKGLLEEKYSEAPSEGLMSSLVNHSKEFSDQVVASVHDAQILVMKTTAFMPNTASMRMIDLMNTRMELFGALKSIREADLQEGEARIQAFDDLTKIADTKRVDVLSTLRRSLGVDHLSLANQKVWLSTELKLPLGRMREMLKLPKETKNSSI